MIQLHAWCRSTGILTLRAVDLAQQLGPPPAANKLMVAPGNQAPSQSQSSRAIPPRQHTAAGLQANHMQVTAQPSWRQLSQLHVVSMGGLPCRACGEGRTHRQGSVPDDQGGAALPAGPAPVPVPPSAACPCGASQPSPVGCRQPGCSLLLVRQFPSGTTRAPAV